MQHMKERMVTTTKKLCFQFRRWKKNSSNICLYLFSKQTAMREKISMLKKRHGGARLPKAIVEKKDVGILIFAYFGHFLIHKKYKTKIGILGDYLLPYIEVLVHHGNWCLSIAVPKPKKFLAVCSIWAILCSYIGVGQHCKLENTQSGFSKWDLYCRIENCTIELAENYFQNGLWERTKTTGVF